MTYVHQCSKGDFLFCLSLCFQNNLSFALNFIPLPSWNRFEISSIPFPLLLSHLEFSSLDESEQACAPSCNVSSNCVLLRCDLHDLSVEIIPNVVSWTHEPPRCMLCLWNLVGFTTLRFSFLKPGVLLCSFIARHRRLHWNFKLSPCVFDGFYIFTIFRIEDTKTSQSSSIIEHWFLVCPFLLFFLLSGLSHFGSFGPEGIQG